VPEEKLLKQATAEREPGGIAAKTGRGTNQDRRSDDERRASVRYAVSAFAEVIEPETRTRLRGRATDLGQGGCYVDAISPFPVGTTVQIRLTSGRRTFQSQACVIYAISGMGMGMAFTEMPPDQATVLRTWVGELSGEMEPQTELESKPELGLTSNAANSNPEADGSPQLGSVMEELVGLLARKRLLSETEAGELRKKLFPGARRERSE
jgi:PilZ domain